MKNLIENKISNLYIEEFSLEKNLKLKSLITMYMIMTKDIDFDELIEILIKQLEHDNNFRINNEFYMNTIIAYAINKGYKSNIIIDNYINNGYYFHSTNGAFQESIKNNGLIIKNKPWNLKELEEIKNIFSHHGKSDIFGLYQGEEKTPIHLSTNLLSSSYYAISSPTWFLHFVSGGMKNNDYDKEAYRNRDYDSCLKNILNLIEEYNLTKEESNKVIEFFNKYYNILGLNTEPILLLIKRNVVKKENVRENKSINETEFDYIKRMINLYCSQNIIIKNNINSEEIEIINYISNKTLNKYNN